MVIVRLRVGVMVRRRVRVRVMVRVRVGVGVMVMVRISVKVRVMVRVRVRVLDMVRVRARVMVILMVMVRVRARVLGSEFIWYAEPWQVPDPPGGKERGRAGLMAWDLGCRLWGVEFRIQDVWCLKEDCLGFEGTMCEGFRVFQDSSLGFRV